MTYISRSLTFFFRLGQFLCIFNLSEKERMFIFRVYGIFESKCFIAAIGQKSTIAQFYICLQIITFEYILGPPVD